MTGRTLDVELYDTPLGQLVDSTGGLVGFRWSAEAEQRWGLNSPVLSLSLRVGVDDPGPVESFFGALLPEGMHIERLAREVKVDRGDLLGLLAAVGADLAGALRIGVTTREDREPESLDEAQVDALLTHASGFLVGGGGSALSGFQRKLTLTRGADGEWIRGNGILPSTHILKPVESEHQAAAEAEHYTLELARAVKLTSFESWIEQIGERPVLVIERYDRPHHGEVIERLHQEDAAQALCLPWGGNDKFEQNNPDASLRGLARLLDRGRSVFDAAPPDREQLLRYTTFTVAVGNTDAHAKNYSILHQPDGTTSLAPLYDVAPLALNVEATQSLAMWINGVRVLPDITVEDLVAEAGAWGVPARQAREIVHELLDALIEATQSLAAHKSIEAHVPGYVRGQARNLREGKAARIPSSIPLRLHSWLGTPQGRD